MYVCVSPFFFSTFFFPLLAAHSRPSLTPTYPHSVPSLSSPSSRPLPSHSSPLPSAVVHHNSVHGAHRGSTSSESNLDEKGSRTSQTQSFVNELMQLLRCDNEAVGVQVRETVKEMVSYELSPPVYSYLFQCMNDETSKVSIVRLAFLFSPSFP